MLKLEVEQLDELLKTTRELNILIYLHWLFLIDLEEADYYEQLLEFSVGEINLFLCQKQLDSIAKLRQGLKELQV